MGRYVAWTLLALFGIAVLDLFTCSGMLTMSWIGQTPFYLCLGWIPYLARTLPDVEISLSGLATAFFTLTAVTAGIHQFGRWWMRNAKRSPDEPSQLNDDAGSPVGDARATPEAIPRSDSAVWPVRRTLATAGLIVLLFVAGLSGTAVVHQVAWLATSPEPLTRGGREIARRMQSKNNLKQIGLASHNYHDTHGALPAGGIFDETGRGLHSWATFLLPQVEQQSLFETIDLTQPWHHPVNAEAVATLLQVFQNPGVESRDRGDAPGPGLPAENHYAANAHLFGANHGMMFSEIIDGRSTTLLAGEAAGDFKPWADPTNVRDPALGINIAPDGFGGPYRGGANFLFADGSVRFLSEEIDPAVLQAIATPAAGDRVPSDF